jgi:hypothetical protein
MNWDELLSHFSHQPLFHSSLLRAFGDDPHHIQIQLSRWVKANKLTQIRRGWYLIEKPFRSKEVSDAAIANAVVQPSYLSLDWALQFYGLIPEATFHPTSVTTRRGIQFAAAGSFFSYFRISPGFFSGYELVEAGGEKVLVGLPEKALLDKVYLFIQKKSFSLGWLEGLRLQKLESLNVDKLRSLGALAHKRGFARTVDLVVSYITDKANRE